jgi:hypothetical protein
LPLTHPQSAQAKPFSPVSSPASTGAHRLLGNARSEPRHNELTVARTSHAASSGSEAACSTSLVRHRWALPPSLPPEHVVPCARERESLTFAELSRKPTPGLEPGDPFITSELRRSGRVCRRVAGSGLGTRIAGRLGCLPPLPLHASLCGRLGTDWAFQGEILTGS